MIDKENKWIKFYPSLKLPKERVSIAYVTHDERGYRFAYGYFQFYNGTCGCFWKDGNEQPKVVKAEDIKYWMHVPSLDVQEEPVSAEFEDALIEEWNGYVNRGAATVDALEDNTHELAFSKGFYRGSNWQKNHIWHDANERPKKSGVKTAWITNDKVFYSGWYNKSAFGHEDMRDSITKFEFDKIRKWCYLDDLLNTD